MTNQRVIETISGLGVSPGVAAEPAFIFLPASVDSATAANVQDELSAFERAVAQAVKQVERIASQLREDGREDEAGILDAQALMLEDPAFHSAVGDRLAAGAPAVRATQDAAFSLRSAFEAVDDPYLAARAADVQDIADRVCRNLTGQQEVTPSEPCILVAHDLSPSQTATLDRALVRGFVLEAGGPTSHTAILARSQGIPAVVGVGPITARIPVGSIIAIDGERGVVTLDPTEEEVVSIRANAAREETMTRQRSSLHGLPAETRDGRRVTLAANIGSLEELSLAQLAGAEGIGLFRTEFLFAGRPTLPTEDEQVEAYTAALEAMSQHTVVIRTLDVGGDKPLPYLPMSSEANPFLGVRGIRYTLAQLELFSTQLRALLRASRHGRLAIMVPMVSGPEEVEAALQLMHRAQDEVGGRAEFGVMVEVPSAALLADALAVRAAFASVGSNDLVQYTLAVDRTNERVAPLYRPLHPAVLRLLAATVQGMHGRGRWVGICGEMAGDTSCVPLLLGLGFDEFSVSPGRLPAVKEQIRSLTVSACEALAQQALTCTAADEVEEFVSRFAG